MFYNRRSLKPFLLAGIAGAAYYAYTKMSEEQKKNLVDTIKKQGKDIIGGLFGASKNGSQENTPQGQM